MCACQYIKRNIYAVLLLRIYYFSSCFLFTSKLLCAWFLDTGTYHVMNCLLLWFITFYHILCSFELTLYKVYSFYAKSCRGFNDCCQILCFPCHVNSWKNECHDIILISSMLSILPFHYILVNKSIFLPQEWWKNKFT